MTYGNDSTDRGTYRYIPFEPCGSRGTPWICVTTKPLSEIIADVQLRAQGFGTYLPLIAHSDKIVPLFPRYLFAQCTEHSPGWGVIRSTIGTTGVLLRPGASEPATVPVTMLRELWAMCHPNGIIYPPAILAGPMAAGQRVQIKAGAFSGCAGVVFQPGRERVRIMLEVMGGRMVSVPAEAVVAA